MCLRTLGARLESSGSVGAALPKAFAGGWSFVSVSSSFLFSVLRRCCLQLLDLAILGNHAISTNLSQSFGL